MYVICCSGSWILEKSSLRHNLLHANIKMLNLRVCAKLRRHPPTTERRGSNTPSCQGQLRYVLGFFMVSGLLGCHRSRALENLCMETVLKIWMEHFREKNDCAILWCKPFISPQGIGTLTHSYVFSKLIKQLQRNWCPQKDHLFRDLLCNPSLSAIVVCASVPTWVVLEQVTGTSV